MKIAGAQAGTIEGRRRHAGLQGAGARRRVDGRFLPFHRNATCAIRPEGLIAENYVDCDPGSAEQPAASCVAAAIRPTVPVHEHDRAGAACSTCSTSSTCPTRQRSRGDPRRARDRNRRRGARTSTRSSAGRNPGAGLRSARRSRCWSAQKPQLATIARRHQHARRRKAPATPRACRRFLDNSAVALTELTAAHRERARAGDQAPAGVCSRRHDRRWPNSTRWPSTGHRSSARSTPQCRR